MKLALLALLLTVSAAGAHEAMQGWSYPFDCCSGQDCAPIDQSRVEEQQGGYLIDHKHFVRRTDARWSGDGRFHACFPNPNSLRCFFRPPNGA
jgi:hypothetical protein